MATLDELVIRIKADASQLERELKRAGQVTQQQTSKMSGGLTALRGQFAGLVPAVSLAALVSFGKHAIDAAGRMTDLAASIGFSAATLSKLEGPLADSGASLDQFAASVNLMNANIGEAVQNIDGPAAEAFQRLGLAVNDLKRLSPEEQFNLIAKSLAGVKTQFEQTELGRAIFGRGFAAMIPLLKETNGELENLSENLSKETLDRIDAFGDALGRAGRKARDSFLEAFAAILEVIDAIDKRIATGEEMKNARLANYGITDPNARQNDYLAKAKAAGFVTEATKGTVMPPDSAGTSDVSQSVTKTKKLSDEQKRLNDLMAEGKRITEANRTAYEIYTERVSKAQQLLSKGYIDQTTYARELAAAHEEMADAGKKAMDETGEAAIINAKIIKDYIGDAMESAVFDFKSFGSAASSILDGIARKIARQQLIDPISNSLSSGISGMFGSGGLGSLFGGFFAEGGRPPVGVPSIVGERGPEIFIPDSAGTVLPNGMGMGGITVVNNWSFSPGIQGTVRAEIMQLLPVIEARSTAAVLSATEMGGRASKVIGKRS